MIIPDALILNLSHFHLKHMSANFKYKITRVFFMCMWLHTSEDPHGPVHSADITTDQHFHKQSKELRPSLRPVPVGDG